MHLRLLAFPRVRYVLATAFVDTFFFFGAYSFLGPFLQLKFDLSLTLIGLILAIALRHLDIPPRKRYAWEDEKDEYPDE